MSVVMTDERTVKIAALNDAFRTTFRGGRVVMTQGVNALSEVEKVRLFRSVREFNNFELENDPYGERDFGRIEQDGAGFYFKIDYYDADCHYGSEDASDPAQTTRILTIMRVEEY
jgi:hypothetical protein